MKQALAQLQLIRRVPTNRLRSLRLPTLLAGTTLLAGLALGCASGSSEASTPKSADAAEASASSVDADEPQIAEASGPDCSDGTCFECGEHLCVAGSLCVFAEGEGSCIWLEECAGAPDCACATQVLGNDCSCQEAGGQPQLRCQ